MFAAACVSYTLSVTPPPALSEVDAVDPVHERTVVSYEMSSLLAPGNAPVSYLYATERVPERLVPNEVVEKRNESSYTALVGQDEEGRPIYELRSYADQTYVNTADGWYYVEHDTTTKAALMNARHENPLAALFWKKTYADSVSPFAGAGDGEVRHLGGCVGCLFNDCAVFGSGSHVSPTAVTAIVLSSDNEQTLGEDLTYICNVRRVFLPFDTSAIPAGSTVSAATVNVYVTSKTNTLDDGLDYITVVETSQATHTTLAISDFALVGSTQGVATPADITSISTGAYLTLTLNATGIGFINFSGEDAPCSATNGITCIGLNEGHDFNNVGLGSTNLQDSITISTSEQTGTSQDPYLSVTYTPPAAAARSIYLRGNVYLRGVWLY